MMEIQSTEMGDQAPEGLRLHLLALAGHQQAKTLAKNVVVLWYSCLAIIKIA